MYNDDFMFSVKLHCFSFSADGRVSRKGACPASLHVGCQPKWSPQPEAISESSRKHSGFNSQTPLQQVCPGRSTNCQMPLSSRYEKQFLLSINTPRLSVRMTKPVSIRADSHYTSRFRSVIVPSPFRQIDLCSHCRVQSPSGIARDTRPALISINYAASFVF